MRIGIVQTRGIGDIIIALPIARYFIDRGHEVTWPIDSSFMPSFQSACPEVAFRAVSPANPSSGPNWMNDYWIDEPLRILHAEHCDKIHILYHHLGSRGSCIANPKLAKYLKFDEYKYAVAEVPFAEKWRLSIRRNAQREQALLEQLVPKQPYALLHSEGSNSLIQGERVAMFAQGLPIVRISLMTNNIFDWLLIIERATRLIMIDSCFANLVEQLGLDTPKQLWLRNPSPSTPVYRSGWSFVTPTEPEVQVIRPSVELSYSVKV